MSQVWENFSNRLLYGIAKRVGPTEEYLWDDMVQEGWLRLVSTKHQPTTNPDAYYRSVVQYAMIDFLRRERRAGRVISFARAKRLGRLCCPGCNSNDIAWTVFWPSLVRCRDCAEQFTVEQTGTDL
jgi:DNA-directed RNA polymerase specialized sigma24 family protein